MDLTRLLAPRSVVVVGATDRPASYGGQTARNLVLAGFEGGLDRGQPGPHRGPRDPAACRRWRRRSLRWVRRPTPSSSATPAAGVPDLVDECGRLGAGGVVVYAAGFAEAPGEEQGPALQAAMVAAAARHDLPVIGPNGNGVVAVHSRAPLWGDAVTLRKPGGIALITQSGNVGVNALSLTTGPRFHTVVSGGNQAVVDAVAPARPPGRHRRRPGRRALSRVRRRRPPARHGARPLRRRGRAGRRPQGRPHRGRARRRGRPHCVPRRRLTRLPRAHARGGSRARRRPRRAAGRRRGARPAGGRTSCRSHQGRRRHVLGRRLRDGRRPGRATSVSRWPRSPTRPGGGCARCSRRPRRS